MLVTVWVDAGGGRARCSVLGAAPSTAAPADALYSCIVTILLQHHVSAVISLVYSYANILMTVSVSRDVSVRPITGGAGLPSQRQQRRPALVSASPRRMLRIQHARRPRRALSGDTDVVAANQ